MTKIVVANPMGLSPEQITRLKEFGEVKFYQDMPASGEGWLKRCQGFDIICSWMAGLREKYGELKNVFISVPFVGVSSFADPEILKKNNITLSNSPGCNRHAVAEWVTYMILTTMRRFDKYVKTTEKFPFPFPVDPKGLAGKRITILGKGNIGQKVGIMCEAFDMHVTYLTRGGDLAKSVKGADIIVNVLSSNPTTKALLNKEFFDSLTGEVVFISPVVIKNIEDVDAMLKALDEGRLSYVAHDVADARPGDSTDPLYEQLHQHPKVFTTPHIAGFSDVTTKISNDMMIDNVEAWLKGKPINVFGR